MQKLRTAFLGTPEIACGFLSRLAASGHEVAGVISQPDRPVGRGLKLTASPVSALAGELKLPLYKPASRAGLHEAVAALRPDLCVVVAYGRLIPEGTLALARQSMFERADDQPVCRRPLRIEAGARVLFRLEANGPIRYVNTAYSKISTDGQPVHTHIQASRGTLSHLIFLLAPYLKTP